MPDWPGWDSLGTVSRIHSWTEFSGIILLGLLVIAEAITWRYSARKDFLTEQQQTTEKRQHDDEIARLHLDTANANERAAQLEKESAEAKTELGRITVQLRPRSINQVNFTKELSDKPKVPVQVRFIRGDAEAYVLARQFVQALASIQWGVSGPTPIDTKTVAGLIKDRPPAIADAAPNGIAIFVRVNTTQEMFNFKASPHLAAQKGGPRAPWILLADAMAAGFGTAGGGTWTQMYATDASDGPPEGALMLFIGPKP